MLCNLITIWNLDCKYISYDFFSLAIDFQAYLCYSPKLSFYSVGVLTPTALLWWKWCLGSCGQTYDFLIMRQWCGFQIVILLNFRSLLPRCCPATRPPLRLRRPERGLALPPGLLEVQHPHQDLGDDPEFVKEEARWPHDDCQWRRKGLLAFKFRLGLLVYSAGLVTDWLELRKLISEVIYRDRLKVSARWTKIWTFGRMISSNMKCNKRSRFK